MTVFETVGRGSIPRRSICGMGTEFSIRPVSVGDGTAVCEAAGPGSTPGWVIIEMTNDEARMSNGDTDGVAELA